MSSPESSEESTKLRSSKPSSPSTPEGSFEPGHLLAGRYRMINLIGKGGMGEVYRVQDLTLDQEVALKFLPEKLANDPLLLALFHKEVRIARQVTHRNVCRMYDIGEVDGRPFLSMEYVQGEDLSSLLRRVGRLPEERGLEISRQLCAGLAAAHEQGVLHRDLKPANVMIDENGHVRITDFGLAGVIGEIDDVGSGTPTYMAPEQLKGQDVSVKSDLFAVGLILYELFTGRKAFEAKTRNELLKAHSDSSIPTPTSAVRELSPETEHAILQCLAPGPDQRPSSALAVSAMLPGGDPLGEALAAGRTPSPELVAAAGEQTALPARRAVLGVTTALIGFMLFYALRSPDLLINRIPFDKPPVVLIDRAETLLEELGHPGLAHSVFGFYSDDDYLEFLADERAAATRWDDLASGRPPAMRFYHRVSPEPLVPMNLLRDRPNATDPPMNVPDMARVELDWEGRLLELVVVPSDRASGGTASISWEELLVMAELPLEKMEPATPEWNPPVFADEQRAWTTEALGVPMRVEAAALRGIPVWFRAIGPWNRPRESRRQDLGEFQQALRAASILFVMVILAGGFFLAHTNLKLGRGDRPRALRLAFLVFGLNFTPWLVTSEHYADPNTELNHILNGSVSALFPAAMLWLFYIALEPYVRRIWPHGLIGWTRFFSGRFRDPIVGRDLLVGAAAGALIAMGLPLHNLATQWLQESQPMPAVAAWAPLVGAHWAAVVQMNILITSINNAFLVVLLFVLLWMVTRRAWLALGLTAVMLAVMVGSQVQAVTFAGFVYLIFVVGMGALVLWRFGLLAMITALFVDMALRNNPLTLDLSAWYATPTMVTLGMLIGITLFAFVSSRAGEPLFGRALLPD